MAHCENNFSCHCHEFYLLEVLMFSLKPPQRGKEAVCRAEGFVADTDTDTDRINSNYSLAMIAHLENFEVRMVSVSLAVASGPTFSPRCFTCFSFRL